MLYRLFASGGYVALEDDAFYYLLIARNLVETGVSAAMPGVLTNGYHPLWLVLVALWGWLTGFDLLALRGLEIALLLLGLLAALWALRVRSFIHSAAVTLVLFAITDKTSLLGMETSLLFPAAAVFLGLMFRAGPATNGRDGMLIFLAAGAVIGARLDAALFVLPALALVPAPPRLRFAVFAALALTGAAYLGANHALFGSALPVSGEVKSLGAPTFNLKIAVQFAVQSRDLPLGFFQGDFITTPATLAVLSTGLIVASLMHPRGDEPGVRTARRILAGLVLGYLLFAAKLMLGSSWYIWIWYDYPGFILAMAALALLHDLVTARRARRVTFAALAILFAAANATSWVTLRVEKDFARMNRIFAGMVEEAVGRVPVAMGDRAGSFAWHLGGGLFQLEGLVNSAEVLPHLTAREDLRPLLCAHGVPHVIDYEVPLGDYDAHRIEIFGAVITSFRGAHLTVRGSEQILQYTGENMRFDDDTVYLWKLDCP